MKMKWLPFLLSAQLTCLIIIIILLIPGGSQLNGSATETINTLKDSSTVVRLPVPGKAKVMVDDRLATARRAFENKVRSESQGMILFDYFKKTNGYERSDFTGQHYVIEYEAQVVVQQDIWKPWNLVEGDWKNFQVLKQQPDRIWGTQAKFYSANTKARLNGKCRLIETDNGWRAEEFKTTSGKTFR